MLGNADCAAGAGLGQRLKALGEERAGAKDILAAGDADRLGRGNRLHDDPREQMGGDEQAEEEQHGVAI